MLKYLRCSIIIFFFIIFLNGCVTSARFYFASTPAHGEKTSDIVQQRVIIDDLLIHVQPRNKVHYKTILVFWIIPFSFESFEKSLIRRSPPFIVELYVHSKKEGYSIIPNEVSISINGQDAITPSNILGPLDHTEGIPSWSISLNKMLGRIRCETDNIDFTPREGVNSSIFLVEDKWLCYELSYNIAVPWPSDDIKITVGGIKYNDKEIDKQVIKYKEIEYVRHAH